jgi:hypothetical protein
MCAYYVDFRFRYQTDNPFTGEAAKEQKAILINYLNNHADEFKDVDTYNDYHFAMLVATKHDNKIKNFYGLKIHNDEKDNNYALPKDLKNRIQSTLLKISSISPKLKAWASERDPAEEAGNEQQEEQEAAGDQQTIQPVAPSNATPGNDANSFDNFQPIPIIPSKMVYSKSSFSLTTYDATTDRCISFDELQKLTCNLARSRLTVENNRDEAVVKMEEEKRKELIREIVSYREVSAISANMTETDISDMTIQQLEACRDQCKKYFEHFKTVEVFKRGSVVVGTLYDTIFPNGIPISKKKKIRLDGVGTELTEVLFDTRSTTGRAFSELLSKYNFAVSNEMLLGIVIVSSILKKVKIEDRSDDEDEGDGEEEDSEEDEDDE